MHRHPSVLIVEDAEELSYPLAVFIRSEGYEVDVAADGIEALDKLEHGFQPCIILLDLSMPRMDGFAFRERQLGDPRFAEIPVIVHSGLRGEFANIDSLKASALLPKPVELLDMIAAIRQHCLK